MGFEQRDYVRSPDLLTSSSKIVYLPVGERIPTPQTIFVYSLLHLLGDIPSPENAVFDYSNAKSSGGDRYIVIPTTRSDNYRDYLHDLVEKIRTTKLEVLGDYANGKIKRLHDFAEYLIHCKTSDKKSTIESLTKLGLPTGVYELLTGAALNYWPDINSVMSAGDNVIDMLLNTPEGDPKLYKKRENTDGLRSYLTLRTQELIQTSESDIDKTFALCRDGRMVTVPVNLWQPEADGSLGFFELKIFRNLGRLNVLKGQKIGLGVVGPPNSGKSTLVANLAQQMNFQLVRFQAQGHGSGVRCEVMDFDAATPDAELILKQGKFDGFAKHEKTKWSPDIADELANSYLLKEAGIYITNMPGGKPDTITDTLLLPLDSVILIIGASNDKDWSEKREVWSTALRKNGLKPDILVRSRLEGEKSRVTGLDAISNITSIVWQQIPGFEKEDWIQRIGGRAVEMNRKLKDYDVMIADSAKLLLLDILPRIIIQRKLNSLDQLKLLEF